MKNLQWENLLDSQCPMCGYFLEQIEDNFICKQHEQPYRISNKKFLEVKRSLQEKRDFSTDFIKNL